jgi:hypothetical protein
MGLAKLRKVRSAITLSAFCLLIAMPSWGCAPTLESVARTKGAEDLDCPTYVSVYAAQGGMFVSGCGRWIEYSCFYATAAAVCVPKSEPKPLPDT